MENNDQAGNAANQEGAPQDQAGENQNTVNAEQDGQNVSGDNQNQGDKAVGGKEGQDDTQQKANAPEKYEFVAPEGKVFDSEVLSSFSEVAKEIDLSQEQAQKILDKVTPVIEARQIAQAESVQAEWLKSSQADKEFGGDKLDENLGLAKKVLDQYGTPELKEFLNTTKLGNHPEVIRIFYKMGKEISEDKFVGGHKEGTGGVKTFNDMANKLYGS